MKQNVSNQMDGDLNTQQFAVELGLLYAVQTTLQNYLQGFPLGEVVEVSDN